MNLADLANALAEQVDLATDTQDRPTIIKQWLVDNEQALKDAYEEENQPVVTNPKAPGDLKVGDYVFASRWSDCDPGDPWAVGHVSVVGPDFVVVGDVSQRRWPRAMRITHEQGARIVAQFPDMEDNWTAFNYKAIASVFGADTGERS
jgi:hypothetical protein